MSGDNSSVARTTTTNSTTTTALLVANPYARKTTIRGTGGLRALPPPPPLRKQHPVEGIATDGGNISNGNCSNINTDEKQSNSDNEPAKDLRQDSFKAQSLHQNHSDETIHGRSSNNHSQTEVSSALFSVNIPFSHRLPSQTISFGSAEILTVPEVRQRLQQQSANNNNNVRVTGELLFQHWHADGSRSLLLGDPLQPFHKQQHPQPITPQSNLQRGSSFSGTHKTPGAKRTTLSTTPATTTTASTAADNSTADSTLKPPPEAAAAVAFQTPGPNPNAASTATAGNSVSVAMAASEAAAAQPAQSSFSQIGTATKTPGTTTTSISGVKRKPGSSILFHRNGKTPKLVYRKKGSDSSTSSHQRLSGANGLLPTGINRVSFSSNEPTSQSQGMIPRKRDPLDVLVERLQQQRHEDAVWVVISQQDASTTPRLGIRDLVMVMGEIQSCSSSSSSKNDNNNTMLCAAVKEVQNKLIDDSSLQLPFLQARIVRQVNGTCMKLYTEALLKRRAFLQQQQLGPSPRT